MDYYFEKLEGLLDTLSHTLGEINLKYSDEVTKLKDEIAAGVSNENFESVIKLSRMCDFNKRSNFLEVEATIEDEFKQLLDIISDKRANLPNLYNEGTSSDWSEYVSLKKHYNTLQRRYTEMISDVARSNY